MTIRRWASILLVVLFLPALALAGEGQARNVILLIGDGMGAEQIKAAGLFANGKEGSLHMETLAHQALVATCPVEGPAKVTDSAAAGTALACGVKTHNGCLGVDAKGKPVQSVLECFAAAGRRTGLVTTVNIEHATPAAFGSHVPSRKGMDEVARQYLADSRPDVLMGGVEEKDTGITPENAQAGGYAVVTTREALSALKPAADLKVSGQFAKGYMPYEYDFATGQTDAYKTIPHLSEMTAKALDILSAGDKGFFLMVEGGKIDQAGHKNELERNIYETLEFDRAVQVVTAWAAQRTDTLVIVTADHETGGLAVVSPSAKGEMPQVTWLHKNHTGADVRAFATGVGADAITGKLDNTDIPKIILKSAGLTQQATTRPAKAQVDKEPQDPTSSERLPGGSGR